MNGPESMIFPGATMDPIFTSKGLDLYCADALVFLRSLPNDHVDIVFLDPPFNLSKAYGSRSKSQDRIPEDEFCSFMRSIVEESSRVLAPGGALFFYHLPFIATVVAPTLNQHLVFRHWIAVSMKSGFPIKSRLYPAHYALLYYTKGEPSTFRRPKLPIAFCRNCGKSIKDYGGYRRHVEAGVNLSDFWDDLSPVRHSKYKTRSCNELPPKIYERVISIAGDDGGIYCEPFCGSGKGIALAARSGMNVIACDIDRFACAEIAVQWGKKNA